MSKLGSPGDFAKRVRNGYLRAHIVEYVNDRSWSDSGAGASRIVLLRPTALSERARSSRLLVWLTMLTCLAWPLVFRPLLFWHYLRARRERAALSTHPGRSPKRIVLCTSPAIMRIVRRVSDETPKDYLSLGAWTAEGPPAGSKMHNMLAWLEVDDLRFALDVSRSLGPSLWRKGTPYSLRLQSYDTYRWALLAIYLVKTDPAEVWVTNYRDRWGWLVDDHFWRRGHGGRFAMIQHGLSAKQVIRIPKLRSLSDFWYFDAESRYRFAEGSVVDPEAVLWRALESSLSLTRLDEGDAFTVLFVSHRMHAARMRELVDLAGKRIPNARFYYKPHPLHPEVPFTSPGLRFVDESSLNPEVDAVVSYNSAIAVEYAALGFPVVRIEENDDNPIVDALAALAAKKAEKFPRSPVL